MRGRMGGMPGMSPNRFIVSLALIAIAILIDARAFWLAYWGLQSPDALVVFPLLLLICPIVIIVGAGALARTVFGLVAGIGLQLFLYVAMICVMFRHG